MNKRPERNEYEPYHERYVSLIPETAYTTCAPKAGRRNADGLLSV